MHKKVSVSLLITTVIIAMTVTFSITMVMAMRLFDSTVASVKEKEQMYSKIAELDKYVRAYDYYTIDETTLYDTIASGYLLGTGDKDAKYYTAAAYSELLNIQTGKLMGIGVEVAKDATTGYAKIIKVYTGSPAADLGMEKGCYITAVGETDVKQLATANSIQARLRGESGTTVDIKWLNSLMEEKADTITRRSYVTRSVEHSLVREKYGYIRIVRFDDAAASQLDYAINSLTAAGATSLVLDLRDNAGGSLDSAVECLDLLCAESMAATVEYKSGTTRVLGRTKGDEQQKLPLVCLVNAATADAAELFAYDLRVLNGAKLVGETTMGKGMVLSSPQRMSDGSAVVITLGRLLACDGTSFEGTGVPVDVERLLSADEQTMYHDYTVEDDPQILRAFEMADSLTGSSTVGEVKGSASSAPQGAGDEANADSQADPNAQSPDEDDTSIASSDAAE